MIDFSAKNQTIMINQSEYKPTLQWFAKYDLDKDLKTNNKRFSGFVLSFTLLGLPHPFLATEENKQQTRVAVVPRTTWIYKGEIKIIYWQT